MKIKTVWDNVERASFFDNEVNALLEDGWQLSRREFIPGEDYGTGTYGKRLLYAELVKLDEADMEPQEPDPITWQEAVEVIKETCNTAEKCADGLCPMYAWCQKNLPTGPVPSVLGDPE